MFYPSFTMADNVNERQESPPAGEQNASTPSAQTMEQEGEIFDQDVRVANIQENLAKSSDLSTMASKWANSSLPLVSDDQLTSSAKRNIADLKKASNEAYRYYISAQAIHPVSENTQHAFNEFKLADKIYQESLSAFQLFESINKPVNSTRAELMAADSKKFSTVPPNLPFLQLKSDDYLVKKNLEAYDSVYDFCTQFKVILHAHSLSTDDHWERLLPMSLNNEERSWFEENLANKMLSWKEAESILLDHCDTPYRKFLLMNKVFQLKQTGDESIRAFGSRFQRLRRQAGLKDDIMLVLAFFNGLRAEIRKIASMQISARFGNELPSSLEPIIQLVSSSDDDYLSPSRASSSAANKDSPRKRESNENDMKDGDKSYKSSTSSSKAPMDKSQNNSKNSNQKICRYCDNNWFKGHRCDEFYENKKLKVSRMAKRSAPSDYFSDDDNDSVHSKEMSQLALHCKSSPKLVKRDFIQPITNHNIFPLLINSRIKAFALLDTGANFSSIDKSICLNHKLKIEYIKHINKNFVTKKNFNDYYIRLADSEKYVERIGTCTLSITCNNKTINKTFEVMNLTTNQQEKYTISIGTDYMHLIGIGISGLPVTWDDHDSKNQIREADRRYNNTSELLESIKSENESQENCPACTPEEYEKAMQFIQSSIAQNQSIPKGSFCTIPESVVHLNTTPNKTAFRRPYPVPKNMEHIVDEQVQEWLDNGIIKVASANTEWNTPLTIVKKTNGKGEIIGHRVCHDPRHVNILLESVDRMPLPIIHELFEDMQGNSVFSTLDLKSAFNSLKLNPQDAHKLCFMWRNVQYQPIGTVFGIRHVSSQFQRTMSIALAGLPFVRYFVDDIVCASKNFEEHKNHLKQVIDCLTKVNLKLNPDKCHFFQSEIYLLGFRLTAHGISVDKRKLINLVEFPKPKCGKDVMRYCGLINYFRTHIPNVSSMMSPLDALRNEKSLDKLWNDTHDTAFHNLKKALLSDTVISFPDMNKPFCISCDASLTGIGAVLYQVIDGKNKYVSFIAKSLSKSERKYSATKRELLALVFSLKRFHKYIYGSVFTLFTDHQSLCHLHTQKIANLMMISWMDIILQYDFKIVHLPGISNVLPDTLSRLWENNHELSNELVGDKSVMYNRKATIETLPSINSGEYFTPLENEREDILKHEHSKGHFGSDAILNALKRKGIYWLTLRKDADELIKACIPCQRHNISTKGYNPLRPVLATLPGDSWGIDLAGPFTTSTKGNNYLLVMIDIATKYYVLKAIPDKTALTVATEVLKVICTFGPMRKLQSDKGTEFVNSLMTVIKENLGFEHALISQFHPRSNGASERAVQSAVKTIKKLINGNVGDWDLKVPPTQLFLNTKYNLRTKSTPFSLMFGHNANDFEDFGKQKDKATTYETEKYLQKKIKLMTEIVYPAVYEQVKKVTEKQKQAFDDNHKIVDIPIGSTVMIYIVDMKGKFDATYEGYYTVMRKTTAGTYVLKNEKGFYTKRNYPPSLLKVVSDKIIPKAELFYEVDAIIGHKKDDEHGYLYRCTWKDYDESHDSWEPPSCFTDAKFITEYWRRIGEIPESIKAVNKANKRKLKELNQAEKNKASNSNAGTKRQKNKRRSNI